MVVKKPIGRNAGVAYPPAGAREGGARVDFRSDIPFDNQIEWHGVRLGWVRMTYCPCIGTVNTQTMQADPLCTVCNGLGLRPFQTPGYFLDGAKVGTFTEAQKKLITDSKAMVIRAVWTSMASQDNMFSVLGHWGLGTVMVTVRPQNKLGYFDRLIYLDDVMPYGETVTYTSGNPVKLRYPAEELNFIASLTHEFTNDDVVLDGGDITFLPGKAPADGTKLSVNYLHHPVFVVQEYVHFVRTTNVRNKPPAANAQPMGDVVRLPLQVIARLEYLPLVVKS